MFNSCSVSRNKMCYFILALSIGFFLSSVCTYAVLAMTKSKETKIIKVRKSKKNLSNQEQNKILKKLKRIEKRMNKINITKREQQ